MPVNQYEKYKKQSVMTMTPGEMLVRLYEEVVKQLSAAEMYLNEKNYEKSNQALQKAQKILNHLRTTLNFKYEISNNLSALYDFFLQRVIKANIKKDPEPLKDIIPMISELRETFMEAERINRMNQ